MKTDVAPPLPSVVLHPPPAGHPEALKVSQRTTPVPPIEPPAATDGLDAQTHDFNLARDLRLFARVLRRAPAVAP